MSLLILTEFKRLNFYFSEIGKKTYGFLTISGGIEINQFAYIPMLDKKIWRQYLNHSSLDSKTLIFLQEKDWVHIFFRSICHASKNAILSLFNN